MVKLRISGQDGRNGPDGEWIPVLNVVTGLVNTTRFVTGKKEIIIESEIDIVMGTRLDNVRTVGVFFRIWFTFLSHV